MLEEHSSENASCLGNCSDCNDEYEMDLTNNYESLTSLCSTSSFDYQSTNQIDPTTKLESIQNDCELDNLIGISDRSEESPIYENCDTLLDYDSSRVGEIDLVGEIQMFRQQPFDRQLSNEFNIKNLDGNVETHSISESNGLDIDLNLSKKSSTPIDPFENLGIQNATIDWPNNGNQSIVDNCTASFRPTGEYYPVPMVRKSRPFKPIIENRELDVSQSMPKQ